MSSKVNYILQEDRVKKIKEERINCKHTSFNLCVCASAKNAGIFV